MLTDDQYEDRKTYIGGSDISDIAPWVRSYGTPMGVWLNKTGREERSEPVGPSSPMYWGDRLEDDVANAFAEESGVKVQRRRKAFRDKNFPWRGALIDRWVVGGKCGVEIKNRGMWRYKEYGPSGGDECLDTDIMQAHWCMGRTGADRWYVAVLIGGSQFRWYRIPRDGGLVVRLNEVADEFWHKYVVPDVAPPPETMEDIGHLVPEIANSEILATADMAEDIREYKFYAGHKKRATEEMEKLKVRIISAMDGNNELVDGDGKNLARWIRYSNNRFDLDRFRKEEPELCKKYTVKREATRFTVK